jgi:hypothetical protein
MFLVGWWVYVLLCGCSAGVARVQCGVAADAHCIRVRVGCRVGVVWVWCGCGYGCGAVLLECDAFWFGLG